MRISGWSSDVCSSDLGRGKSELEAILERWSARQDRVVLAEPTPERGYFYRSDHFSLAKQGVPMLYAEAGEDLRVGGVAAGKAAADDYTANRYHEIGSASCRERVCQYV